MANWARQQINELCDVTSSKRIYAKELRPEGVPFLRSKEIIDRVNGSDGFTATLFISEERFQEIVQQTGAPTEGDLLLTSRGTLGVPYLVRGADRFHFADGNLTWFRKFRNVDSRFLKFFFMSPDGKAELQKSIIGTSQQAYTIASLKKSLIPCPPISIQRQIADFLSAYEELIENNRRRIRILEEMARKLYREWFVHLRFPGHENHPRVASPLGEIPRTWEVSTLGKVTTKIGSGATPRGGKEAYYKDGISLIRSLNIYDYQIVTDNLAFIDEEQAAQLSNVVVEPRDILLNITGASVARCSMVPAALLPARVNQHVAIIRADEVRMDPFFLLDLINNDLNKRRLLSLAQGGATREALTKGTLADFYIVLPPINFIKEYVRLVGPMHMEREALSLQNGNLRRTRDLLLPRLLSRQIDSGAS